MTIFTIIAIVIIFFLWFNTSVYDYNRKKGYWDIDYMTERRLPFTVWRILGLALLLIPWFNIVVFAVYIFWYIKRASEPDGGSYCIIYRVNVKEYSPFVYDVVCFIGEILNKRIV